MGVRGIPPVFLALIASTASAFEPVDFTRDVLPLLSRACLTCHSETLPQAGLSLTSKAAALKGGLSGPALVEGDAAASLLVKRVLGGPGLARMPMGLQALGEEEVALLRRWIDEGARWPDAAPATGGRDLATQVKAVFEARCVRCHGADLQRSGLRLDSRAGALRGGLSGPVVIPGHSERSALLKRLSGAILPRMPFEGPPLPAAEIARIKAWIDAGAPGADDAETQARKHWAYVRPQRPEPPVVADADWVRNPIDHFVLARLQAEGLRPAPEASRETLIRRVSLDLIGLPPTLDEVDAFLADGSPDAYEKAVDRLLASPHYGERWARPWLDLARYADTNGYEKDRRRMAFKYRDWVIDALNQDMPFDRFTVEQIAGDMLEGATDAQKIATGFHRNTLLNQEGGIDVEEARWETLVDRVNTTAAVWLGTTMACAQCHNHKYDPIPQKDYYRMLAFFDHAEYAVHGLGDKVVDKWIVEPDLELPTPEQAPVRAALRKEEDALEAELGERDLGAELDAFVAATLSPAPAFTPLRPVRFEAASGARLAGQPDASVLATGEAKDKDTYTLTLRGRLDGATALRLEALPDPSLPAGGPGRSATGGFVLTGLQAVAQGRELGIRAAMADASDEGATAAMAIDHHPSTGWGVTAEDQAGKPKLAVFRFARPLQKAGDTLTVTLDFRVAQASLGRFRLSVTRAAEPWGGLAVPAQPEALLAWFRPRAPSLDASRDRLRQVRAELHAMNMPTALVMQERPGFDRPSTPLRIRGSFLSPGERVYAATPGFLPPLPDSAPANRLGLARWLVSPDNPLTARVTVNRLWEQLFGRGLVLTSEDFGSQGDPPTHPALLDWLATEFVTRDWSLKKTLRLLATSATYRQASETSPALRERDPDNRLLARGPRFRVEAETVRDLVLAASGLLSEKVGGPSVFPDQPEGVWDNPYSDDKWTRSEGEDRYRRSLYTFARRTAPYPMLTTFDAPSREFCTVRRVRTNTPLQALTTLNDPAFFTAARALADRALREAGPDDEARATRLFRLATGRRPAPAELRPLLRFEAAEAERFAADAAAALAVLGPPAIDHCGNVVPDAGLALASASERAAWTLAANVVLNLDETLTKE